MDGGSLGKGGRPRPRDEATKRRMEMQSRADTAPELAIRRGLHRQGLRYRVNFPPLPRSRRRRADIVFTRARVAVFVDGCFWHGCPEHGTLPKNNRDWWRQKIEANRARDLETDEQLRTNGWTVLRFWEHDAPESAVAEIVRAVKGRGRTDG